MNVACEKHLRLAVTAANAHHPDVTALACFANGGQVHDVVAPVLEALQEDSHAQVPTELGPVRFPACFVAHVAVRSAECLLSIHRGPVGHTGGDVEPLHTKLKKLGISDPHRGRGFRQGFQLISLR
mmetsp:Transcript_25408/g.28215  ORF Transcript_25408/g.28215 Transcript_25408/m.28215 type:complete len:126 (+) Transcript_25408:694-1071(+)